MLRAQLMHYMAKARRGRVDEPSLAQDLQPQGVQNLCRIGGGPGEAALPEFHRKCTGGSVLGLTRLQEQRPKRSKHRELVESRPCIRSSLTSRR